MTLSRRAASRALRIATRAPGRATARFVGALLAALAFAAGAQLSGPAGTAQPPAPGITTITTKVEAIDLASRVVAVRGPLGRVVALQVDDRVRNLAQVKAGDTVVLRFTEAESLALAKGGAGANVKPPVPTARQVRVVAKVEALDGARQVVLLEGPGGRCAEVRVNDAAVFGNLAVGDNVEIAYVEARVVAIDAPKK